MQDRRNQSEPFVWSLYIIFVHLEMCMWPQKLLNMVRTCSTAAESLFLLCMQNSVQMSGSRSQLCNYSHIAADVFVLPSCDF